MAEGLYAQAQAHVQPVLAGRPDGTPAYLADFIRAQRTDEGPPTSERFQLPEPILGPIPSKVQVLVVGLNPGYGPTEDIPTLSSSLEEYVAWYATRMDRRDARGRPISCYAGVPGIVRHYVAVERDYLTPVLGERALGRAAVYADAVPWKWNRPYAPPLRDPQIGLEAHVRIDLIAAVLQPDLLLVFGGGPAGQLSTPWPSDDPSVCDVDLGEWRGSCLPVWHPNRQWLIPGAKRAYLDRVEAAMQPAIPTGTSTP